MCKWPLMLCACLCGVFYTAGLWAADDIQPQQVESEAVPSELELGVPTEQPVSSINIEGQQKSKTENNKTNPAGLIVNNPPAQPDQTQSENLSENPAKGASGNDKSGNAAGFGFEDETLEQQEDIIILEWSRDLAKDYVESLNDGVDSFFMGAFFDDELVNDESSGSNGRVFFTTRRVQGEGVDYQVGINLKLVLPRSRDRFKLLVETDENEDSDKESDLIGTTDNVTYSTAIRVELKDGKRWKSSLDNGIRWAGEPVYFTRIRTRRTDYLEEWRLRLLHSVSWRTDVEWGSNVSASLLRPIDLRRHFRTGFSADYLLSDDFANLKSSAAVFDELSHRSAMLYQVAVFGDTDRIAKVSNTVLTVSYRRKIYKHFVFAEIVPEVAWPREQGYEATPALNLQFEMIFGPDKL